MDCDSTFGVEPDQMRQLFEIGLDEINMHSDENESPVMCWDLLNEKSGNQIGGYQLMHIIGEGGMGIVYLAEQSKPIKRQVALKVVKPGMDSASVIARFETERQALARLNHPNIAHVYDAGMTESGRSYFVMEYVKGVPITEYCDYYRLTIEDRLNLFILVCHAVQHAHQKGIIHRDIKPSNILVYKQDEKAVPKIIDFGVAKATAQSLIERTFVTEQGQLLGTPEYMSPEQVDMAVVDVDTRSDVYSLGAVLYELLSGIQPFDPKSLRESGFDAMRRTIIEQDPLRPSTQLCNLEGDVRKIAENRSADVRTLIKGLAKELEWIPLKAIRKEPTHRYQSASELANDIDNYLNGVPLIAGPESTIYRMQKFVRRHRVPVLASVAVVITLIIGFIVSTTMYVRAQRALDKVTRLESYIDADRNLTTAEKLHTQGQYTVALKQVEAALDKQDLGPKAHLLRAKSLFDAGRISESERELQQLIEGESEIAGPALYLLARINLDTDPVKANDYKQRAEAILPKTVEAYSLRAITATTTEEALEWLSKALVLDPAHYESRKARVLLNYKFGQYQKMAEDVEVLIALRPGDPFGYALRAIIRRQSGQMQSAIEDHDRAIDLCEVETELPNLYDQRRETYVCMGDYKAALEDSRHCALLQPEEFIHRFHTFTALVSLGEYEAAKQEYKSTVQQSPEWHRQFIWWSVKHTFNALSSSQEFEFPLEVACRVPFSRMVRTAQCYHTLKKKAVYLVSGVDHVGAWSPDGKEIVYQRSETYVPEGIPPFTPEEVPAISSSMGMEIFNIESGTKRLLLTFGQMPAWSPDGKYIAFVTVHRGGSESDLWIVPVTGGKPSKLVAGMGAQPVWSKDSRHIFFLSAWRNGDIYSIEIDDPNAKPQKMIPCTGRFVVPENERELIYETPSEIRAVDLYTGSNLAKWVTPWPNYGWCITLSPDGEQWCIGDRSWYSQTGTWIYDTKREQSWQIFKDPVYTVIWAPDGSRIAIGVLDELWLAEVDPSVPIYQALVPVVSRDEFMEYELEQRTNAIEADPFEAEVYFERALVYLSLKNYDEAKADLQEFTRLITPFDKHLFYMMCWWGSRYFFYNFFEEGELLMLQAAELLPQFPDTQLGTYGQFHPIENLVSLYEAWNKPEEAEKWRAKLLQTEAVTE